MYIFLKCLYIQKCILKFKNGTYVSCKAIFMRINYKLTIQKDVIYAMNQEGCLNTRRGLVSSCRRESIISNLQLF